MKELDARAVDLVIHSDDTFRTVENTLGFMVTSPKFVSYLPDEVSEEDQDVPSDCSQDFHFQPYSSPEPDMTCNGTQAMVSQVEALEAVIQKLEWTQILILHDQSHGQLNALHFMPVQYVKRGGGGGGGGGEKK